MNIKVYVIPQTGSDVLLGTATDKQTLLTLISYACCNGIGVSLHGPNGKGNVLSGEMCFSDAREYAKSL